MNSVLHNNGIVRQLLRYCVVGLVVLACDFAVYALVLALLPDAYVAANACGKIAGALTGFVLHRNITFTWKQRHGMAWQFARYLFVFVFNLVLSSALLMLLIGHWGANEYWSKLAVDVVVTGVAFTLSRLWVYRAV